MAIGDPYCNVADYQAVIGSVDAGTSNAINSDLVAVSRWLDRKLGRFFNVDTNTTQRVYVTPSARSRPPVDWAESENPYRWGNYWRTLEVDDISESNSVVVQLDTSRDGSYATTVNSSDYELQPQNAPLGPEARPYERINMPEWSTIGGFQSGMRVKVTAKFGWPAVPAAIKRAVIDITSELRTGASRAEQAAGGVTRLSVSGGLAVDYSSTDAAAQAHRDLVASLMREYGRARRYV